MVIGNSSLRSCPLEAGEEAVYLKKKKGGFGDRIIIIYLDAYENEYIITMEALFEHEALLFNRDSLNDFAIPFRRGRVETGSK